MSSRRKDLFSIQPGQLYWGDSFKGKRPKQNIFESDNNKLSLCNCLKFVQKQVLDGTESKILKIFSHNLSRWLTRYEEHQYNYTQSTLCMSLTPVVFQHLSVY